MWAELLSGVAGGGDSGGGGATYGNSGSSAVSTDVATNTSAGGIGALNLDFSNRAFAPQSIPTWALLAGLALAAYLVLRK